MSIWDDDTLWKPKDDVSHALSYVFQEAKKGIADAMSGGRPAYMTGQPDLPDTSDSEHELVLGKDKTSPKGNTEKYLGAASRGAAGMIPFGLEAPIASLISGAAQGVSSEGAHELFPSSTLIPLVASVIAGAVPFAAHPVFARSSANRLIKSGMDHPAFSELLPVVINLEHGGTINHPNVSPKGAMGVMQVMPKTATHPGFGVKSWDGKSQADLARVGRDYLAVMTKKYDGDHAKILAAYNDGPGAVDGLIRKYGDNWVRHLPEETKDYVANGLQKVFEQHDANRSNGPVAPDGLPGNGSVHPIPSEDLAKIMNDPAAAGMASEIPLEPKGSLEDISGLSPEEVQQKIAERDNVVNLPEQNHLTPAEMQDMDASVSNPPSINDATDRMENVSTNEAPPEAANDAGGGMGPNDPIFGGEPPQEPPQELPASGGEEPPQEPPSGGDGGGETPQEPLSPEELFTKVSDALKKAVPARAEQKKLYSEERSRRVKEISQVRQVTSGVEGFHAEKAKLRGELPVADYSGLTGLGQQDIQALFDHVKNHPNLGYLQSINAREGLAKMLQGQTPTNSEISLLSRTMPPELLKQLRGSKGLLGKVAENAANVLNVPKALMASYDVSAPMRQGVIMIGRKEFYTALGPMMKSLVSPKYQAALFESMYRDPLFSAMQDADLAVPVYKQHNGGPALMDHEEPYMTNLAQKIPLVGIGVRASERAYNAFVYKLRFDTFKSLYALGKSQGKVWDHDSLKDLSKFINSFTGRGDLGRFENLTPVLNSAFFSPKLLKSRMDAIGLTDAFVPGSHFYAGMDPFVRKEALKSLMGFAVFATTTMGLAMLAGAEVGLDPRKADGWKIKVGNTRYDIMGGVQQLVRLMANIATYTVKNGKQLVTTGGIKNSYKDKTAIDSIGQFLRNKESPDVSLVHDLYSGRDAVGQDVTVENAIVSRVTPMVSQDAYDAYADLKAAGAPVDKSILLGTLKAVPSFGGVGTTTYPPHEKKSTADPFNDPTLWGDQKDVFNDPKLWGSQ